jgi:hypothetical protein
MAKYYRIHLFTPGVKTASNNVTLEFTEPMLQEVADTFTPKRRVPMTLGHKPAGHMPSLGWVKDTLYEKGNLYSVVKATKAGQALIDGGYYENISASLYPPNYVANPVPGKWSLRHIAALGAEPPALKDLDPILEVVMDYSEIEDEELVAHFDEEVDLSKLFYFSEASIILPHETYDFSTAKRFGRVFNCKPGHKRCGGRCIDQDWECSVDKATGEEKPTGNKEPEISKRGYASCPDGMKICNGECIPFKEYCKKDPEKEKAFEDKKADRVQSAKYMSVAKGIGAAALSVGIKIAAEELGDGSPMTEAAANVASGIIMGQITLDEEQADAKTRISKALYDGLTTSLESGINYALADEPNINPRTAEIFSGAATRAINTSVGDILFSGKIDGSAAAVANSFDFALTTGYKVYAEGSGKTPPEEDKDFVTKQELGEVLAAQNRMSNKQTDSIKQQVQFVRRDTNRLQQVLMGLDKDLEGMDADQLSNMLSDVLTKDPNDLTPEELRKAQSFLSVPIYLRLAQYLDREQPREFSEPAALEAESFFDFSEFDMTKNSTTVVERNPDGLISSLDFEEPDDDRPTIEAETFFSDVNSVVYDFGETNLDELYVSQDQANDAPEVLGEEDTKTVEYSEKSETIPEDIHEVEGSNVDPNTQAIIDRNEELQRQIAEIEEKQSRAWIDNQVGLLFSETKILPGKISKEELVTMLVEIDTGAKSGAINFSEGSGKQANPVDVILGLLHHNERAVAEKIEVADFSESVNAVAADTTSLQFSESFTPDSQLLIFEIENLMASNSNLSMAKAYEQASAKISARNRLSLG